MTFEVIFQSFIKCLVVIVRKFFYFRVFPEILVNSVAELEIDFVGVEQIVDSVIGLLSGNGIGRVVIRLLHEQTVVVGLVHLWMIFC